MSTEGNSGLERDYSILSAILKASNYDDPLIHYTSSAGALGILTESKIRCSHIFYLNDTSEYLHGWKVFFEVLNEKLAEKNLKQKDYFNYINEHLTDWRNLNLADITSESFRGIDLSAFRPFVFSFSRAKDELSQWRSYTTDGFGFAIQFKLNKEFLKNQTQHISASDNINQNCTIFLAECIYEVEEIKKKIAELLTSYYKLYLEGERHFINGLYLDMLTLNAFFKHSGYKNEKESRLLVFANKFAMLNGKYVSLLKSRKGKSYFVPYIELDLKKDDIESVMIGPTPYKYHSEHSLRMLLESQGINSKVTVEHSTIPYRAW